MIVFGSLCDLLHFVGLVLLPIVVVLIYHYRIYEW